MSRVDITEEAADMLRRLFRDNGPLMFHQSGGGCDGSAPMCYPAGEFLVSEGADVLWGVLDVDEIGEIPVYMSAAQFEYWKHTHVTIDLVPGRGAGFSLEAPTGYRFLIRSRLLTDQEYAQLEG
jgi:uncharacterized protein